MFDMEKCRCMDILSRYDINEWYLNIQLCILFEVQAKKQGRTHTENTVVAVWQSKSFWSELKYQSYEILD